MYSRAFGAQDLIAIKIDLIYLIPTSVSQNMFSIGQEKNRNLKVSKSTFFYQNLKVSEPERLRIGKYRNM